MSTVSLTVDGIPVTVPAGATVLEAARQAGIAIPTLCHDPELTKPGACRLCVVEIQGMRNLPASCVTTAAEGMVVSTCSPAVVEARQTILDLLLMNHPQDCLTCHKAGDCRLQDYAYEYGVRQPSFQGERHNYPLDDSNPFIARDLNKCILCGKCVRVCEEVQGRSVVGFAHRGFNTRIAPPMDVQLGESDCVFCGSCVSVCPVGALAEKQMLGLGRSWEIEKVRTVCPYCGTGCTIELNVKGGKVIGVTSTPEGEVNGRALCVKGRFGYNFIHHPDRLKTPLIRKDGEFVEATWDEALNLVAEKFREIKDTAGPDALAVLTSARCTNEENYLVNKFARAVLGTNNIDHCARL
ncbi:NADH dehydrogenase [Clostridiales bacterium PH28_bin88]|nr:NADH dehydrogenase [Clostridiales bacterium PH28_bin88]